MGWAERDAKGEEDDARPRRSVWRTRLVGLGAILAAAGGFGLYSDTRHQIYGRSATATLMEHLTECTVEYQRIGEWRRREKWPCAEAEEFQQRVGSNKVRITRNSFARVRFPLEDGRVHEVNVDDVGLGSYKLAIGATLPVVYAPDNPTDVRPAMRWERFKILLILLAVGVACLALALSGPLAALYAWAFRGRGEETVSATSERLAPVNTYSRTTGSAPRASFGKRNR